MGLNEGDIRRIVWTFVMGAAAWAIAAWINLAPGEPVNIRAIGVGAIAAALSAVKNLVLPDESSLK